ncbi:response regulator transcription factor [Synechococcus sp. RSCCF101]|uniref:helix-turn-helix transcriptional regulator n=1 Tax=Synechococcus sp. RSCCF101 TaxID=2511069 RepID=UPI001245A37C|nr:response regulator transcription factor [Synechococcus sp. RSCCF101]QEY31566.1 response regulator transcription factor [Synechococcus sp. RSCCF101]
MELDPHAETFMARSDLFRVLLRDVNLLCCLYPRLFAVTSARLVSMVPCTRRVEICTSAAEALAYIEEQREPHVAVVSEHLEDGSGLELIRALKRHDPPLRCMLLLTHNHRVIVDEAVDCGADCVFLESSLGTGVVNHAVEAMLCGERYLDENLIRRSRRASSDPEPAGGRMELSRREVDVLSHVGEGLTNLEIAERMHLAPSTVRDYLQSSMRKLGTRDRASSAVAALREGYLN